MRTLPLADPYDMGARVLWNICRWITQLVVFSYGLLLVLKHLGPRPDPNADSIAGMSWVIVLLAAAIAFGLQNLGRAMGRNSSIGPAAMGAVVNVAAGLLFAALCYGLLDQPLAEVTVRTVTFGAGAMAAANLACATGVLFSLRLTDGSKHATNYDASRESSTEALDASD